MRGTTALRSLSVVAGGIFLAFAAGISAAQETEQAAQSQEPMEPVDLELVIATDVSGSIDYREAFLQRKGVADAFRTEEVVRAIQAGTLGKIGVVYIEWSGEYFTRIIADWRIIHDAASATGFSDLLMSAPPTFGQGTSIGGTMMIGAFLIETNNLDGRNKTIDISGDGPSNRGRPPAIVRDEMIAKGININGLPIITGLYGGGDWGAYYGDIEGYYRNCVIGGPRSFVMAAHGFDDFAEAIRRKLVLEISQDVPDETARIIPASAERQYAQFVNPLNPAPTPPSNLANCITGYGQFFDNDR